MCSNVSTLVWTWPVSVGESGVKVRNPHRLSLKVSALRAVVYFNVLYISVYVCVCVCPSNRILTDVHLISTHFPSL